MQRVLPKTYAERDVADVELYVRDAVHGLGNVRGDEQDRLVARGIFVVRRIAQALPPEVSLQQALSGHLTDALTAYRSQRRRDLMRATGRAA
jgi:hypothetical protein